eukprot:1203955-Amphidinium_carterae.1
MGPMYDSADIWTHWQDLAPLSMAQLHIVTFGLNSWEVSIGQCAFEPHLRARRIHLLDCRIIPGPGTSSGPELELNDHL